MPVTEDAHARLRLEAARLDTSMGRVISNLAEAHLPKPPKAVA